MVTAIDKLIEDIVSGPLQEDYVTTLDKVEKLDTYSSDNVADGLIRFFCDNKLIDKVTNPNGLWRFFEQRFTSLLDDLCYLGKQTKAEELLESLKVLYSNYFSKVSLPNSDIKDNLDFQKSFGPVGDTCFMLWDLTVIPHLLIKKALEILESLLQSPVIIIQLSALHGLGHLARDECTKHKVYQRQCYAIIEKYISTCKRDDLKLYANHALQGKI